MSETAAFDVNELEAERKARAINLGDGKTYTVRVRNFGLDKELDKVRVRREKLAADNRAIEAENARLGEDAKPKSLKEDPKPYEDLCIFLEDEDGNSPPHEVLAALDIAWIFKLRDVIWPEDVAGKTPPSAEISESDGG